MTQTTTVTLTPETYNRAKALAEEQHVSIDTLMMMLIQQQYEVEVAKETDNGAWDMLPNDTLFNPYSHTKEDLVARFCEIEKELETEEGITHEEMMAKIKQEFLWLR